MGSRRFRGRIVIVGTIEASVSGGDKRELEGAAAQAMDKLCRDIADWPVTDFGGGGFAKGALRFEAHEGFVGELTEALPHEQF